MFVNYTHPDELREVGKRKQVLSFAARPRRNAALLQTAHRRGTFSWTREPTCCNSPQSSETESEVRKALSEHDSDVAQEASDDPMDDLLGYAPSGGLRVDPFGAFPVKVNPKATKAIDICATTSIVSCATLLTQDRSSSLCSHQFCWHPVRVKGFGRIHGHPVAIYSAKPCHIWRLGDHVPVSRHAY